MMTRGPGLGEDTKNVTLIGVSACAAILVTGGLLFAGLNDSQYVTYAIVRPAHVQPSMAYEVLTPLSGSNRLYGVVRTVDGDEYTGFIRWDRNEGSLTDLLDASKPNERGGESISGIRFGHVSRIQVMGDDEALFTLKSGDQVTLTGRATDLGSGLRALLVDSDDGMRAELGWNDLAEVEFMPPPRPARPNEGRLFGTLTTRKGLEFTGFIAWDVDEIYSSDILDGDRDGERLKIPFGAISAIERFNRGSALVTLHNGEEMILDGTNDVNQSIRGISVSDLTLGQIKLGWDEFDRVVFHGTDTEASSANFDGGHRIEGTLTTRDGRQLSGLIRWDRDEAFSWEMLNGEIGGIEFDVEFGNIERIEKSGSGAAVTLRDGRELRLSDSNDVDGGNRGIVVENNGRTTLVNWRDFQALRISN